MIAAPPLSDGTPNRSCHPAPTLLDESDLGADGATAPTEKVVDAEIPRTEPSGKTVTR